MDQHKGAHDKNDSIWQSDITYFDQMYKERSW
jgi:hypothetical protein